MDIYLEVGVGLGGYSIRRAISTCTPLLEFHNASALFSGSLYTAL